MNNNRSASLRQDLLDESSQENLRNRSSPEKREAQDDREIERKDHPASQQAAKYLEKSSEKPKILPNILKVCALIVGIIFFQEFMTQDLGEELKEFKKTFATQMANQRHQQSDGLKTTELELEELKKNFVTHLTTNAKIREELRSANKNLEGELAESKKTITQLGQAVEELRSANKDLKEELAESRKGFEAQMTNNVQAREDLRSKAQTEFDSLRGSIQRHEETQARQQGQFDELQRYTTNTLIRVAHHESGSVLPGDTTPLKVVTDPNQGRCIRDVVKFEKPFSSPPKVIVSLSLIDSSETTGLRLNLEAHNISVDGFELVGCTWWNSIIHYYVATWFAYEN